ncbi:MAG: hypothetical protein ACYCRE_10720 [Acidobacteriaceae bacterium]
MAQVVEFSGDSSAPGPLAIVRGDLPPQLDRLLLTVPSLSELYTRLSDFLLNVVEVGGVWLGSPDEEGKVSCHFFASESVAEFLSAGSILILLASHSLLRSATTRVLRQAGYEVQEALRLAGDYPRLRYPRRTFRRRSS